MYLKLKKKSQLLLYAIAKNNFTWITLFELYINYNC